MATTVINIKSGAHYDVYCGRAGHGHDGYYGNPFRLEPNQAKGTTLQYYKSYFYNKLEKDIVFKTKILALKDKILGCFCKPHPCHCDIIIEWLDKQ